MRFRYAPFIIFLFGFTCYPVVLHAQKSMADTSIEKGKIYYQDLLFDHDDMLRFTLVGKLNDLFNDRDADMAYHPMLLQYTGHDSSLVSIQLMAKTRGHFRRLKANCKMPPLLLSFLKSENQNKSVFEKQNKLKLVVPCQGDEYVIREWLVYKLYNIITEKSFKVRYCKEITFTFIC